MVSDLRSPTVHLSYETNTQLDSPWTSAVQLAAKQPNRGAKDHRGRPVLMDYNFPTVNREHVRALSSKKGSCLYGEQVSALPIASGAARSTSSQVKRTHKTLGLASCGAKPRSRFPGAYWDASALGVKDEPSRLSKGEKGAFLEQEDSGSRSVKERPVAGRVTSVGRQAPTQKPARQLENKYSPSGAHAGNVARRSGLPRRGRRRTLFPCF